jgi:protocatechuate 3,4-dioxygenase beta subunit
MEPSTRRRFLLATGTFAGLTLAGGRDAPAQELPPTPSCHDGDEPTVRQTEGPFFKPSSPERADLRQPGAKAKVVELSGLVLTRRCQPVARALVDLWHADENGDYDNSSFRYRGHQFTDASGLYRFRTIMPAVYVGRTRHYHVKVQAPGGRVLTTQLYFPNEPGNRRDGLFRRELLMRVAQASDGLAGRFDFVLDMR